MESLQCPLKGLVIFGQNTTPGSNFSVVKASCYAPQKKKEKDCFEKMRDRHLVFKKLKMVKFPLQKQS